MLDSSCGSLAWMPLVLAQLDQAEPGFRYYGSDVACHLIKRHQATYANRTNWQFGCLDASNEPLPRGYDVVFSRDSLQHLPMSAVYMFLSNVKASGARFLLVGSYISAPGRPNVSIKAGDYMSIDLTRPPFRLQPAPLAVVDEHTEDGKHLLLFDVSRMEWDDNGRWTR